MRQTCVSYMSTLYLAAPRLDLGLSTSSPSVCVSENCVPHAVTSFEFLRSVKMLIFHSNERSANPRISHHRGWAFSLARSLVFLPLSLSPSLPLSFSLSSSLSPPLSSSWIHNTIHTQYDPQNTPVEYLNPKPYTLNPISNTYTIRST